MTQRNTFLGENKVTLSDEGIRIQNLGRLGFVLVAHRPDWTVNVYRSDDKTYYSQSLDAFCETGLCSEFVAKTADREITTNCLVSDIKFGRYTAKRVSGNGRTLEYLPLNQFPSQLERILFAAYKAPTNKGIPLSFSRHFTGKDWMTGIPEKDERREILATLNEKDVSASMADFTMPTGYRPVKAIQEVVCSKENRDGAADFKDLFEIGEHNGKGKKLNR